MVDLTQSYRFASGPISILNRTFGLLLQSAQLRASPATVWYHDTTPKRLHSRFATRSVNPTLLERRHTP
jgi:hypothetical protein